MRVLCPEFSRSTTSAIVVADAFEDATTNQMARIVIAVKMFLMLGILSFVAMYGRCILNAARKSRQHVVFGIRLEVRALKDRKGMLRYSFRSVSIMILPRLICDIHPQGAELLDAFRKVTLFKPAAFQLRSRRKFDECLFIEELGVRTQFSRSESSSVDRKVKRVYSLATAQPSPTE